MNIYNVNRIKYGGIKYYSCCSNILNVLIRTRLHMPIYIFLFIVKNVSLHESGYNSMTLSGKYNNNNTTTQIDY